MTVRRDGCPKRFIALTLTFIHQILQDKMPSQQPSWQEFFNACLRNRLDAEKFRTLVEAFQLKTFMPSGRHLISVLLTEGRKPSLVDPRVPLYARELLHLGSCSAADVLYSMLPPPGADPAKTGVGLYDQTLPEIEGTLKPSMEALILQMLTLQIADGLLKTTGAVQGVLRSLVEWMTRFPSSSALGYLISATLNNPLAQRAIGNSSLKCKGSDNLA